MRIPSTLLTTIYRYSSLENLGSDVQFDLHNRLRSASIERFTGVTIDGREVPREDLLLLPADGRILHASTVSDDNPIQLALNSHMHVRIPNMRLKSGMHQISIAFRTKDDGDVSFSVTDSIVEQGGNGDRVPRDRDDNFTRAIIEERLRYARERTGSPCAHLSSYSFDPHVAAHNIENFIGVAQVPLGLAGPLRINGEHAQGEYLIPLATSEGTLVASYNRGMKVLNLCGGANCSVAMDCMQRAPVFVFANAREARDFTAWIDESIAHIRRAAEETSHVAKLLFVDQFLSNKFAYLRFNFSTGDGAGQNMVGRATFAACSWILDQPEARTVRKFYLESNFATDKKSSQVNIMCTRGKRVTAEAVLKREILEQHLRVVPENLAYHWGVANVGGFLSGVNNNGLHSPNAITALFIATGQDVANVSESSAGVLYSELTADGDFYLSLTIPSLIVGTYGGGTGLATQSECLALLGCQGKGKVRKFAEIVAGVALAGEISLAAAISAMDWVSSHEQYGRNR